jgi:hypothetical protein
MTAETKSSAPTERPSILGLVAAIVTVLELGAAIVDPHLRWVLLIATGVTAAGAVLVSPAWLRSLGLLGRVLVGVGVFAAVACAAVGLLGLTGRIFATPEATITSPPDRTLVGPCEHVRGTSSNIPDDQTLVLSVLSMENGTGEHYLAPIDHFALNDLADWGVDAYFDAPQPYEVSVYEVPKDVARIGAKEDVWHLQDLPDSFHYLAKITVIRQEGLPPSAACA